MVGFWSLGVMSEPESWHGEREVALQVTYQIEIPSVI